MCSHLCVLSCVFQCVEVRSFSLVLLYIYIYHCLGCLTGMMLISVSESFREVLYTVHSQSTSSLCFLLVCLSSTLTNQALKELLKALLTQLLAPELRLAALAALQQLPRWDPEALAHQQPLTTFYQLAFSSRREFRV